MGMTYKFPYKESPYIVVPAVSMALSGQQTQLELSEQLKEKAQTTITTMYAKINKYVVQDITEHEHNPLSIHPFQRCINTPSDQSQYFFCSASSSAKGFAAVVLVWSLATGQKYSPFIPLSSTSGLAAKYS